MKEHILVRVIKIMMVYDFTMWSMTSQYKALSGTSRDALFGGFEKRFTESLIYLDDVFFDWYWKALSEVLCNFFKFIPICFPKVLAWYGEKFASLNERGNFDERRAMLRLWKTVKDFFFWNITIDGSAESYVRVS